MPMSLGESGRGGSVRKGRAPATPWRRLLGHPAVWAILVNNFTFHYAFYVVMNWLPTYFDKARTPGCLHMPVIEPAREPFAPALPGSGAKDTPPGGALRIDSCMESLTACLRLCRGAVQAMLGSCRQLNAAALCLSHPELPW